MRLISFPFLVFPLITLFISVSGTAQHCQYDFSGIIAIAPCINGDTSQIIDGLHITLTDSLGNPIIERKHIFNEKLEYEEREAPYTFWRNPKPNKDVNHLNSDITKRHFYFANNYYVLVVSPGELKKSTEVDFQTSNQKVPKFYIKIEDKDSLENGGYFKPMVLAISLDYYLPLCSVSLDKRYPNTNYYPLNLNMTWQNNLPLELTDVIAYPPSNAPFDSITTTLDTLYTITGELSSQRVTTDYYKKIDEVLTIVERRVCMSKGWFSERSDCWIYHLKDGVLVNDEFIQGAE